VVTGGGSDAVRCQDLPLAAPELISRAFYVV